MSKDDVETFVAGCDLDQNGGLSFGEFLAVRGTVLVGFDFIGEGVG